MEITLLLEFDERGILPYLDVVEEALCFGWIDSTLKRLPDGRLAQRLFNDSTMTTLQRAIEIAYEAHAGQYDKAGADYINHPLRVMEKGKTEEEKIVGVLHDVIEDSEWTIEMLIAEGFSPNVISALQCLTKKSETENYDDFISRVLTNELAARVKLNDLEDNLDLSRLKTVSPADIGRCEKYKRARALIMERLHLITIGQTHHDKE